MSAVYDRDYGGSGAHLQTTKVLIYRPLRPAEYDLIQVIPQLATYTDILSNGYPVSAIAAVGAAVLFVVAKRGHAINTGKVLRGAPWQIVISRWVCIWSSTVCVTQD